MRNEILRMDHVTYASQGVTQLDNFNLSMWAGEILGLVTVNQNGLEALLSLLQHNLPLRYGHIYYQEKLVNSWHDHRGGNNRISVIRSKSSLARDLTVADNIFVLRPGFRMWRIRPKILRQQLEPFMREIGVFIPADAYIDELTAFQCFVVELLKAVVAGSRLIVLENVDAFISDSELAKLREILVHYASKGISFLYLSFHFEETLRFCHRTAMMLNGRILKYFDLAGGESRLTLPCVTDYDRWVRARLDLTAGERKGRAALELNGLDFGNLRNVELRVDAGECVVILDMDNCALEDFLALLGCGKPERGQLLAGGQPLSSGQDRRIAVVQERPMETMLFHDMSYMDNLCFNLDHRISNIWLSRGIRRSIREEYGPALGADVFEKRVSELTTRQKYDLVFTRLLLQRPQVVFCVHPFKNAEVSIRSHIWELIDQLLKKGAAVVILAVNLADSLALADRLVQLRQGTVQEIYHREDFSKLPINTPWLYLYKERYPVSGEKKEVQLAFIRPNHDTTQER